LVENESQTETCDKQHSIIKLMIDSGMTDKDIRDNVGLFFLAGHETTSTTLQYTLGLLATHPEVQRKARNEVFEKTPNGLTYESLRDFEYLDWIIHESMRLYPAAPTLSGRKINKETIIGDWKITENTIIQIDLVTMLHSDKIWGDPEVFRPERWSPEVITKEQRSSWIPFSYGPRNCIGMNFSLTEQKIFLTSVLLEYSWFELAKDGVVIPKGGFLNAPDTSKMKIKFIVEEKYKKIN